jgi:hypothetical protein
MAPVNAQVVNFDITNRNSFSVVVYYNDVADTIPAGETRQYSTSGYYHVAQIGREAAAGAAVFRNVFFIVSYNSGGGNITTIPGDIRGHFAVTANLV